MADCGETELTNIELLHSSARNNFISRE